MATTNEDFEFDLLNNFAHDLKTPLGAVRSYLELVEVSGKFNDKQQYFSNRASEALGRMQQMIDELLDFARMEADSLLSMESCNLYDLVIDAQTLLQGVAEDKDVHFHIDLPAELRYVHADKRLLRHVLMNLLSNAVKYNRHGGRVTITAHDESNRYLRVEVIDTGIGIPQTALDRVFDRFYRVHSRASATMEGTGLGLSIVKAIIEKHGGMIGVESELSVGSTFYFTLPQAISMTPDTDREPDDDVDDHMQESRETHEDSDIHDHY